MEGSALIVNIYDRAAWGVIIGLAMMVIGGLVLWAYGARNYEPAEERSFAAAGPEAEATRRFHVRLVKMFFIYGLSLVTLGIVVLFASSWMLF
jgi:hypothetical protein